MPGKSKQGGGLELGSAYKMKYQGNHSAFPFKSPIKDVDVATDISQKTQKIQEENKPKIEIIESKYRPKINPSSDPRKKTEPTEPKKPTIDEEVIQMPNPNIKPPGYGLDR